MTIVEMFTGLTSVTLTPAMAFGLMAAGFVIFLIGFLIGLVTDELY